MFVKHPDRPPPIPSHRFLFAHLTIVWLRIYLLMRSLCGAGATPLESPAQAISMEPATPATPGDVLTSSAQPCCRGKPGFQEWGRRAGRGGWPRSLSSQHLRDQLHLESPHQDAGSAPPPVHGPPGRPRAQPGRTSCVWVLAHSCYSSGEDVEGWTWLPGATFTGA